MRPAARRPFRLARVPLEPRVQELDALLRRQKKELEALRADLALARRQPGASAASASDISAKVARLLRVLRLRYVRSGGLLEAGAQWVSRVAESWLERERRRLLDEDEPQGERDRSLLPLLNLPDPYSVWRRRHEAELDRASGACERLKGPLISVVLPVYKVAPAILAATLRSLQAQTYRDWEACIAFADPDRGASLKLLQRFAARDRRLRVKVLDANYGISGNSNAALELVRGDYVALLDHDDELPPLALARMASALRRQPQADFLYSDKEMISEGGERRFSPLFKPEWSPEMLYSVNYLTHLNLIRTDLMHEIGGWAMGVDGAQDWDLFLRATEKAKCVVRVPGVSYSWRVHAASTASGIEAKPYALQAQLRSLERHALRIGLPGRFEPNGETGFRLCWREPARPRLVALAGEDVAPLYNLLEMLQRECDSFTELDLLATPTAAWTFMSGWRAQRGALPSWCHVRPILGEDPRASCLDALRDAAEEVIVVLDGSLLALTPGAVAQLAGWLYPGSPIAFASGVTVEGEDVVVEAGCILDAAGVAHPLFRGTPLRSWGVFGGPLWTRNVEAASPYMLALRTADVVAGLAQGPSADWRGLFQDLCRTLAARTPAARGVVDASARALIAPGAAWPAPAEAVIGEGGRYLHPFLTLCPERGVSLARRNTHAA